jgi:hypothetical protein
MDIPGTRQSFQKPVRVAIVIFGHPVVDADDGVAAPIDERHRKLRIARLHQNTGHQPEAVFLRNLAFSGAGRDALICAKALRCSVRLRNKRAKYPLRPAKIFASHVFGDMVVVDLFVVPDATRALFATIGTMDGATFCHVVARSPDVSAAGLLRLFLSIWCAWAGPPRLLLMDQQKGFFGVFRRLFEFYDTKIEHVPTESHHKLGRADRHNAAWRTIFNNTVDECGLAGDIEVDIGVSATSQATISHMSSQCGSPQQAFFGVEFTLPYILLGDVEMSGANVSMTSDS